VDFVIGKDCPDCVRGALATKPFADGDLIAKVPFNVTVQFAADSYSAQVRASQACQGRWGVEHNCAPNLFRIAWSQRLGREPSQCLKLPHNSVRRRVLYQPRLHLQRFAACSP
jgi:hypothetical protein